MEVAFIRRPVSVSPCYIFYMVNAFRYGLLGENATDVPIWVSYAVMLTFVVLLGALGMFLLKRGIGLRS